MLSLLSYLMALGKRSKRCLLGKIIETKPQTERLFPNSLSLGALDATAAGQTS